MDLKEIQLIATSIRDNSSLTVFLKEKKSQRDLILACHKIKIEENTIGKGVTVQKCKKG